MNEICDYLDCTGCSACASVCSVKCIKMVYDHEGFLRPNIDQNKCIDCRRCFNVCPNNTIVKKHHSPDYYQMWNRNKDVLVHSSSGGFFSALSAYVFTIGGVVFGVYKDVETKKLLFGFAEDNNGIAKFRYSKYYQAEIGDAYRECASFLDKGRYVLFTGTACQIAGLLNYLGKSHNDNLLITADILCHGTPSKVAFQYYLKDKEKYYRKRIIDYNFRIKPDDSDWQLGGSTRMKLFFSDGTTVIQDKAYDTYFTAFCGNVMLRESCYYCRYCGTDRITDFTMADFWQVKDVPREQLKYGVSLILCNSDRSKQLLNVLEEYMIIENADKDIAIANNLALTRPNIRPRTRNTVYSNFNKYGFDKTVKYIFRLKYFKGFIKKLLGKS